MCSPAWTNAILLGMTAYRSFAISRELEGTELPLMKRLVKDGALYFVVITAVDVLNVYFFHRESFVADPPVLDTLLASGPPSSSRSPPF